MIINSISTSRVLNSADFSTNKISKPSQLRSLSSNKPSSSLMIRQVSKHFVLSCYWTYFSWCWFERFKLSDINTTGSPLLLENCLKVRGNISAFKLWVNFKCIARVEAKVKSHMYVLISSPWECVSISFLIYKGPGKSNPMCEWRIKWHMKSWQISRFWREIWNFLQINQALTIQFTACLPRITQHFSSNATRMSLRFFLHENL